MNIMTIKKFSGTPFTIGCTSVENRPGTWNSTKVSIHWGEELIGEYLRNYSSYADVTFYPFMQHGQWFALYSPEYTGLRVMKLNPDSVIDWCGQERSATGFCPTEIFIPKYNTIGSSFKNEDESIEVVNYYTVDVDYENEVEFLNETKDPDYKGTTYCEFGFMAGCVWGDDTCWKLRYIDLSKILDKELIITEKFGYWQLPPKNTLKQCISMDGWEPDHNWIQLTQMQNVNLNAKS